MHCDSHGKYRIPFVNWTDEDNSNVEVSTDASYTFTVTGNVHYTANFVVAYTITTTVEPDPAYGTVTGAGIYPTDATCTLTATPAAGYNFVNWTESSTPVSTDATYSFTVTADRTLVANFEANTKSRSTTPHPRDIYPAPAREPWDWDDDPEIEPQTDTVAQTREQLDRDLVEPVDIPSIDHNTATRGGGIYVDYTKNVGNHTPTKLVFSGGGISDPVKGQINFNYASEAGGGIYIADSGYMQMKYHCEVNANRVPAGKRGAGIYLNGRLYIGNASGDAAGTHGLIVNRNFAMDGFSESGYTGNPTSYATTNKDSLNNVFLTRYESDFVNNWGNDNNPGQNSYKYDDLATVITLLSDISGKDGSSKPYTNVGFSVLRGFCPVVATSKSLWGPYTNTASNSYTPPFDPPTDTIYEKWLYKLMKNDSKAGGSGFDENGALFEDSETYVAIHTRTKSQPFLPKYIYLWGCWTYPAVKEDPENLKPMAGSSSQSNPASDSDWQGHYVITDPENDGILHWDIYSEEGLSWFSSYVNGLNVFKTGDTNHDVYDAAKNPYATATLMNDIDLGSHIWIPIGSVTTFRDENIGGSAALFTDDPTHPHHFKGEFDGQGHTITGMNVRYVSGIYKYGLLGYLDKGAKVKNVFIDNSEFITDDGLMDYSVGGIAGLVTPSEGNSITISASEARVSIDVTNSQKNGTYVGGLVGKTAGSSGNVVTIHSSMAMPEITGAADYMGGLVGQLAAFDSLFNSFSNPKFPENNYDMNTNMYIGGLVGDNKGTVMNCYSRLQNVKGTTADSQDDEPVKSSASVFGWFAGTNSGTIKYCYAPKAPIAAGSAYKRYGSNNPDYHGTYDTTKLVSGKYGFKHRDQKMYQTDGITEVTTNYTTYLTATTNDTLVGGLQMAMNAWVNAKNKKRTDASQLPMYHPWMRTMASSINNDLPIPQFKVWTSTSKAIVEDELYNAVGSKDGVYMDYNLDANTLLGEYVTTDPSTYSSPSVYLYDPNTLADGTTAEPIRVTNIGTTNPNVTFEIHEDVGITVTDGASSVGLKARVGVTFDNSNRSTLPELGGKPYDWHMFGSAINGVSMGLVYHGNLSVGDYHVWDNYTSGNNYLTNGIPNTVYNGSVTTYDRVKMDPPKTQWYQSQNSSEPNYNPSKVGYFPTNTPYGRWRSDIADSDGSFDLYCYGERAYQHWINFKREGANAGDNPDATDAYYDHWQQNMDLETTGHPHYHIQYRNEPSFERGKGYLMAVSERSMLMADGTLNNGNVTYNATYTVNPMATVYDEMVRGTNLIGNPYQSYLDMDRFFTENSGVGNIYYIMDADKSTSTGRDYISYTKGSSYNPTNDAPPFLHPHQGFFVKVPGNTSNSTTSIIFNADMRVAGKWNTTSGLGGSHFRDRINYPLVNLLCYDANDKRDYTTVEINRPDVGGGQKMKGLRNGTGQIYARWDDIDYQTAFTPEGVSEVPVRFEAFEDGVFTMRWSMLHGDFHYVHLIDNLAGADVDMLTAQEYKFEGRTTDYISRFKLVFKVTDVDEYKDDDPGSKTFAFQMGDELIVNGAGILQMFDVTGRCLLSTQTAGAQSSVSLPKVAAGVYMLRLTGNQQNKVQKIIIK